MTLNLVWSQENLVSDKHEGKQCAPR